MPYIGKSPGKLGVRQRYYYTATGSETSKSGTDDNGITLKFEDGEYVDVYLNGSLLVAGSDYNTNTTNTISGLAALAANDILEVIVYDIFSLANAAKKSGDTFSGNIAVPSLTASGTVTTANLTSSGTVTANNINFTGNFTQNGSPFTSGGGSYVGDSGGGLADIIRVHEKELNTSVTIAANTNGLCAGPLNLATGVTITVSTGATLVIA